MPYSYPRSKSLMVAVRLEQDGDKLLNVVKIATEKNSASNLFYSNAYPTSEYNRHRSIHHAISLCFELAIFRANYYYPKASKCKDLFLFFVKAYRYLSTAENKEPMFMKHRLLQKEWIFRTYLFVFGGFAIDLCNRQA